MRPRLLMSALLLPWITGVAYAQGAFERTQPAAEIILSDDTLHARYLTDTGMINLNRGQSMLGIFVSEERDLVGTAGFVVPLDMDFGRFSFALGPRAYIGLLEEENDDVLSLALGVAARFDLSRSRELAIAGEAFYGPDVLTFGSANRVADMSARLEMRVTQRLIGFAGMRWFEMDLVDGRERTLQEELIAGVRWRFD